MRQGELINILQAPIVSEKTSQLSDKERFIAFRVVKTATREQVKRAVEWLFKVEVQSVRVLNVKGKTKRFGKFLGRRSDWKKAYVKLKPGSDIDFASS